MALQMDKIVWDGKTDPAIYYAQFHGYHHISHRRNYFQWLMSVTTMSYLPFVFVNVGAVQ